VQPLGTGSVSFASYAQVVRRIYDRTWVSPQNADDPDAEVKAEVTIARDGQVLSAWIANRSNSNVLNKSVQRVLDEVKFIRPFPSGAKEEKRTFVIVFNLQIKRSG
jgi:outer membrane biosynthesis protein TonB